MFKSIKLILIILSLTAFSSFSHSQFLMGEDDDKWGVTVNPKEDSPLKIKVGARLQTVTAVRQQETPSGESHEFQDFYVRRGRFQFQADFKSDIKFYMDVRNDDSNKTDKGEGDFNIGDAFIQVKNVFGINGLKMRAFRAKVDVSRSETVSSSRLLYLNRAHIADEAAQYVSHNRRASNVQLLGDFDWFSFQAVTGDGVYKGKFYDAKGESLSSGAIDSQNFMVGSKIRISPFPGWRDSKLRETYFGQGKHFSLGAGVFYTGDIQYRTAALNQVSAVNRQLVNIEASFNYCNLTLTSEFFRFDGMVEDFSSATPNVGSSDGYYVQGEYVLTQLSYLAPYVRYELWDRFRELDEYTQESKVFGVNWYLKGNKVRLGLYYQSDEWGDNLNPTDGRGRTFENEKSFLLTSMWHM